MINVLIGLLIVVITATGTFYAAHYIVALRTERDALASDVKLAKEMIDDLEAQVELLKSEREISRATTYRSEPVNGFDQFNIRG